MRIFYIRLFLRAISLDMDLAHRNLFIEFPDISIEFDFQPLFYIYISNDWFTLFVLLFSVSCHS